MSVTAVMGIAALAAGLQGWMLKRTSWPERSMLLTAGMLLVYPSHVTDALGFGLVAIVNVAQVLRARRTSSRADRGARDG